MAGASSNSTYGRRARLTDITRRIANTTASVISDVSALVHLQRVVLHSREQGCADEKGDRVDRRERFHVLARQVGAGERHLVVGEHQRFEQHDGAGKSEGGVHQRQLWAEHEHEERQQADEGRQDEGHDGGTLHAGDERAVVAAPRELKAPVGAQLRRHADHMAEADEQGAVEQRLHRKQPRRGASAQAAHSSLERATTAIANPAAAAHASVSRCVLLRHIAARVK